MKRDEKALEEILISQSGIGTFRQAHEAFGHGPPCCRVRFISWRLESARLHRRDSFVYTRENLVTRTLSAPRIGAILNFMNKRLFCIRLTAVLAFLNEFPK